MDEVTKAFNDMIGRILTYCDEAEVGHAVKKAIKTELWEMHDKTIAPLWDEDDERFGYGKTGNR